METTTQTAKPPTMRHRLRIAAACFCLVLCLGFAALWVQSYFVFGQVFVKNALSLEWFSIGNELGRAMLDWEIAHGAEKNPLVNKVDWGGQSVPVYESWNLLSKKKKQFTYGYFGFYIGQPMPNLRLVCIPYWSLVLLTATLAILLKPKPRLRFSLRELLLLTTIASVVLGAVAALGRVGS